MDEQPDWRWCHKCQGLFFSWGQSSVGSCPAGGQHEKGVSGNYTLAHNAPEFPGQPDWRWCYKCQGLFFSGGQSSVGSCPAGGQHEKGVSGNYTLMHSSAAATSSAELFRDPLRGGTNTKLSLPAASGDQRYEWKRFSELAPNDLVSTISSASLTRTEADGGESSLFLFAGSSSIPNTDYRRSVPYAMLNMRAPLPFIQDFHGDFLRMTLHGGSPTNQIVNDLSLHSFNDRTTSALLVDRWRGGRPEETISVADTFTAPWKAALTMITFVAQFAIGGVSITAIQDPVFTWVAHPPATPNVPNNYVYLVVSQWFVFHAWGIGMNAWLMFYLRLSRDGTGMLELNVVEMDRYVCRAPARASSTRRSTVPRRAS